MLLASFCGKFHIDGYQLDILGPNQNKMRHKMTAMTRGLALAAFLVVILILASCTTIAPPPPEPPATPTQVPQPTATEPRITSLTFASGSTVDEWYPLGAAISTAVTETTPDIEMSVKNTSSMMESLKLLLNGQVDLAFGYDHHVVLANQGNLAKAFPNAPTEIIHIKCGVEMERPTFPDYGQSARVVLPLYEQPLHIVTTDTAGIAGISDLKGKRVSIGVPGTVTEELAVYLLEALAFDLDHDISLESLSVNEAVVALEKGEIDGFFWSGPVPNPDIANLFAVTTTKMVMLPIDGEDAAQIMRTHPEIFHKSAIPANSYTDLDVTVDTLAITFVLAAMEDLPADQVTQVVSTLVESNHKGFSALNNPINQSPEIAISLLGTEAQTRLHKGLAEYFEEYAVLR
jgi:TRAP-type uncharacterized transport system substrate-binding protein